MKTLLAPRIIAWVLVAGGIGWFICISPKTAIEFFDAAVSDRAATQELHVEKNRQTDPAGAAASGKVGEAMSCKRRMDRMALLYDVTNNPQRVEEWKSFIVEGFYTTEKDTAAALRANSESYREAEREYERCRTDIQRGRPGRAVGEVRHAPTAEEEAFHRAIFGMQLESLQLRQFQAALFWRKVR